jgi:hypothetical protein
MLDEAMQLPQGKSTLPELRLHQEMRQPWR